MTLHVAFLTFGCVVEEALGRKGLVQIRPVKRSRVQGSDDDLVEIEIRVAAERLVMNRLSEMNCVFVHVGAGGRAAGDRLRVRRREGVLCRTEIEVEIPTFNAESERIARKIRSIKFGEERAKLSVFTHQQYDGVDRT